MSAATVCVCGVCGGKEGARTGAEGVGEGEGTRKRGKAGGKLLMLGSISVAAGSLLVGERSATFRVPGC